MASQTVKFGSTGRYLMKTTVFAALLFATALAVSPAAAQPAPFNDAGVTMGHWHIISKDVEANKNLFLGMGAKMFMVGGNPLMMFPGVYINLNLGTEKGEGGTPGSVVNHVGFIVNNVQEQVAKWKAAGVPVLPGTNNRPDQAFVVTPDGVRIEILEDKTQTVPVKNEHVHLFVPESDIPKDHAAFVKKLEADGIKLDEPPRQATPASNKITYITDPWGTRIEIIERAPLGAPVN